MGEALIDARGDVPVVRHGCRGRCRSKADPPAMVQVTVDGDRQVVLSWAHVCRVMALRPKVCARCSLLTRWCGLFWCGVPAPVRVWRRMAASIAWLASIATGANVGGDVADGADAAGCGCNLNLKWRLLETPRAMVRHLAALLLLALTGERVELESDEAACPYGLWPTAL